MQRPWRRPRPSAGAATSGRGSRVEFTVHMPWSGSLVVCARPGGPLPLAGPCALLTAMPAEALSGQVMLGSCRRSAAAAWRALAGRLAPSAATAGEPLLASGRRTRKLDRSAWWGVTAAAAGERWRPAAAAGGAAAAAASPAAVAGHPAHSSAPHQQQAAQQAELAHLRQLSEEQLAAVTAPLGTQRVVAGPGSGKVRALACVPAGGAFSVGLSAEAIPCCTRLCMV